MPLAKAASEMVRGAAIGSMSRKMDAGRLAQHIILLGYNNT
jgi:hypothetical protein